MLSTVFLYGEDLQVNSSVPNVECLAAAFPHCRWDCNALVETLIFLSCV